MTPRLNYHVDHDRKILWILHRKNAGTSIRKAIGCHSMVSAEEALPYNKWSARYTKITALRHPWSRVTSALHNPFDDDRPIAQKVQEEIFNKPEIADIDWHLWPQWYVMEGFDDIRVLHVETLNGDWMELQREYTLPDLEHQNQGDARDWREQDFDWSLLLPIYGSDFEFGEWWEKE